MRAQLRKFACLKKLLSCRFSVAVCERFQYIGDRIVLRAGLNAGSALDASAAFKFGVFKCEGFFRSRKGFF